MLLQFGKFLWETRMDENEPQEPKVPRMQIPVFIGLAALLLAIYGIHSGWFPFIANKSITGPPMSDHDRTVSVVQKWAKMGATKPPSNAELAALWDKTNTSIAFYPDACQELTRNVQTAFPERPGLAKGDLRVPDFNAPANPGGKVKTVDDLAQLIMASPPQ
jgi:hypothetical protein